MVSLDLFHRIADNASPDSWSASMRWARFRRFIQVLNVTSHDSILDVGGSAQTWIGSGFESNVTILNLQEIAGVQGFRFVLGDACDMSRFADNAFDIVFSNSVIEHVGERERQAQLAAEIRRVGRHYWVQTPYRHFPLEPHFLFPFFQYLPGSVQRFVGQRWKYSHLKRNSDDVEAELSRLRMLNKREFSEYFPDGQLILEKVLGLTKTMIVYRS
jgi:hypothetical protein